MVEVNFLETLEILKNTYQAFDYKTAILKTGKKWCNVISILYFCNSSVDSLLQFNKALEERWGKVSTPEFKILWDVFPITRWPSFLTELRDFNRLLLDEYEVDFDQALDLGSLICRRESWSSYMRSENFFNLEKFFQLGQGRKNFFEGIFTLTKQGNDLARTLRSLNPQINRFSDFRSVNSAIETWLGIKDFRKSSLYFIFGLPIYGIIAESTLKDQELTCKIHFHQDLEDLKGMVELKSNGTYDNIKFHPLQIECRKLEDSYLEYSFTTTITKKDREDRTVIYLTHPSIPEDLDRDEIRRPYYQEEDLQKLLELPISDLVNEEESQYLDFKASTFYDINTAAKGKMNPNLPLEVVKEIVAFLNSGGGLLVIGVHDKSREVLGIENDLTLFSHRVRSLDGYELRLSSLIKNHIGVIDREFLEIKFRSYEGKDLCLVIVRPYHHPVYLRHEKKKTLDFIIRASNGTQKLTVEEAVNYILDHWRYEKY